MTTSPEQIAAQFQFAQLAVQYHATGRFAALSFCFPVAGNLFHHSIEMFLKCALARALTLKQLKASGHDLNKLWKLFTEVYPDPNHASLDSSIAELDKFERLRYPDSVVLEGMQVLFAVHKIDFARLPDGPQPPYHLVLEDIDLLAQTAVKRTGLESTAFSSGSTEQAVHFLQVYNVHPIF